MRVVLLAPLQVGSRRLAIGDELETTDYSGAKLIARGQAKPKSKSKPKAKAQKTKAKEEPAVDE